MGEKFFVIFKWIFLILYWLVVDLMYFRILFCICFFYLKYILDVEYEMCLIDVYEIIF